MGWKARFGRLMGRRDLTVKRIAKGENKFLESSIRLQSGQTFVVGANMKDFLLDSMWVVRAWREQNNLE